VELLPAIEQRFGSDTSPEEREGLDEIRRLITKASQRARVRIATIERLALQSGAFARMEVDFLFDKTRKLLAIGYNVGERRRDASYYDLLASEARLSTFVAIAQGQLPQESWFSLGRMLTRIGGEPILLSWSGSMFEYLMPLLVMPTYENTLLDETYKVAVRQQIEYGKKWGLRGGCRNPAITRSTFVSTTSTGRLACPAWGSNAVLPRIWSLRLTRRRSR